MSTFECGDNIVLGDGDGSRRAYQKASVKRTPIPSCRRFATRQNHVQDDNQARIKLEEALTTLQKTATQTPKSTNPEQYRYRKRSKTMAEITPTKRKPVDQNLSGDGPTRPPPPRKDEAARRVYQKLLLNSWRRRRMQVSTLTESSVKLQAQVDQLQIQVDVLQKLRESEGKRRSLSACENTELRKERDDLRTTSENVQKANEKLRGDILQLERTLAEIESKNQSLKIELGNARCEFVICEKKVTKEKILNGALRDENNQLTEKLNAHLRAADDFRQTIEKLKEQLAFSEKNLEEANAKIVTLEKHNGDILDSQKDHEKEFSLTLKELTEEREKRIEIEKKLNELKKLVANLNGIRSKLTDDNVNLRHSLRIFEDVLAKERGQKWWRNAATTIVDTLQNAATIMLPAFPKGRSKSTSTSDLTPKNLSPRDIKMTE